MNKREKKKKITSAVYSTHTPPQKQRAVRKFREQQDID